MFRSLPNSCFTLLLSLFFLTDQSFGEIETSYLGEMSPRLCNHHLANYPATRSLYLELSSHLHLIPCVETFSPLDCSECPSCHQLVLKCDLDPLWGSYKCPFCKEWVKIKQWLLCSGPCVNSGYFQKCNQFYFHFFQHFLQYCSENPDCQCYWPENKSIAAGIIPFIIRK